MAMESALPGVDPTVPSAARVYDLTLGGKNYFKVDKEFAEKASQGMPELSDLAKSNRACLIRAVTHFAQDLGIRRYLDLGSGLPTQENVHEVARRVHPDARTVYVDVDPTTRIHALSILDGDPYTAFIQADATKPETILEHPDTLALLSAGEPITVLLFAIVHFMPDSAQPRAAIQRFLDAVPAGSVLAISSATIDGIHPELERRLSEMYRDVPSPLVLRPEEEIMDLFCGLPIVGGELVDVGAWGVPQEEAAEAPWLRAVFGYAIKK
ncbi:hypothetical protein GCM10014719_56900 [Planomonospora parontospora subsp. antibiotica]|nr:hypothetical protein GCM10014719_56900 [Planomonospora parontospora subsp. antibiotica]GII18768.1 hypothetical protein Ppa05_54940 [Planomonospora parontospora subsp. antibiotica]